MKLASHLLILGPWLWSDNLFYFCPLNILALSLLLSYHETIISSNDLFDILTNAYLMFELDWMTSQNVLTHCFVNTVFLTQTNKRHKRNFQSNRLWQTCQTYFKRHLCTIKVNCILFDLCGDPGPTAYVLSTIININR